MFRTIRLVINLLHEFLFFELCENATNFQIVNCGILGLYRNVVKNQNMEGISGILGSNSEINNDRPKNKTIARKKHLLATIKHLF